MHGSPDVLYPSVLVCWGAGADVTAVMDDYSMIHCLVQSFDGATSETSRRQRTCMCLTVREVGDITAGKDFPNI